MIKLILTAAALFALMQQPAHAESVWCRNLSIGCPTEADRAKAFKNCQMLANESYQKALVDGEGVVLGDDVARFLNRIPLPRVEELIEGKSPTTSAEKDLLARLQSQLPVLP